MLCCAALQVGERAGGLLPAAAAALGLAEGTPVFMGGGDAFVGLLGMGVSREGHFGLICGSSNVLSGFTALPSTDVSVTDVTVDLHGGAGAGTFGAFPHALLPGLGLLEAGQSCTGAMLRWFQQARGEAAATLPLQCSVSADKQAAHPCGVAHLTLMGPIGGVVVRWRAGVGRRHAFG